MFKDSLTIQSTRHESSHWDADLAMKVWAKNILLFPCLAVSGCGFVSFEDVSTQSPYSAYVGKEYRSTKVALIYRVSMDPNYKLTPSVYIVKSSPGIAGPEVLSQVGLPVGTTLRVLKVMRCTNCYLDFGERIHMVVQITSSDSFNDAEERVDNNLFKSLFVEVRATDNPLQPTPLAPRARVAAKRERYAL